MTNLKNITFQKWFNEMLATAKSMGITQRQIALDLEISWQQITNYKNRNIDIRFSKFWRFFMYFKKKGIIITFIIAVTLCSCYAGGYSGSSYRTPHPTQEESSGSSGWHWELDSDSGELEYCRDRQSLIRICL